MKKLSAIFAIATLLLTFTLQPAFAANEVAQTGKIISTDIEYLDDGSCYVSVIQDITPPGIQLLAIKEETKSKTTYFRNSAGNNMWYVRVTGTFTYGDGTSKCISATPSAKSLNSNWKVSDLSGGKTANKAYATATGKQYLDGKVISTITKTVTLTCSPTGVFS